MPKALPSQSDSVDCDRVTRAGRWWLTVGHARSHQDVTRPPRGRPLSPKPPFSENDSSSVESVMSVTLNSNLAFTSNIQTRFLNSRSFRRKVTTSTVDDRQSCQENVHNGFNSIWNWVREFRSVCLYARALHMKVYVWRQHVHLHACVQADVTK